MIEVEAPDGTIVEFPPDTPRDVIAGAMRRRFGGGQQAAPEPRGLVEEAGRQVGLTARTALRGPARVIDVVGNAGAALVNAIPAGVNAVAGREVIPEPFGYNNAVGLVDRAADAVGLPRPETGVERGVAATGEGVIGAGLTAGAATLARGAQLGGQAASRLLGTLSANPGTQIVAGGVGEGVAQATDSPLAGVAAALAVPAAASVGGRIITPMRPAPNPGRAELLREMQREGIPVTAGQANNNQFLLNVENAMEQLPGSAGRQQAQRQAQQEAFTRAAWRKAGVDASDTTPATINAAQQRIGGQIGEIAGRYTVPLDQELADAARALRASTDGMSADNARVVNYYLDGIGSRLRANGNALPGGTWREIDSDLGRRITSARSSGQGDLAEHLDEIRDAMRDAMGRVMSPDDLQAFNQARRHYANLKVIERAAGRAGADAAEGRMSPLALREAVDASTGRGYARGQGDLNELARIGQSVLRPRPDSGTSGRTLANNILTMNMAGGGGGAIGAMIGGPLGAAVGGATGLMMPAVAQRLYRNPVVQSYLTNQAAAGYTPMNALAGILTGRAASMASQPEEISP